MHRYRAPSIAPGTFFVAQSWADFIINMSESNLRQAHGPTDWLQGKTTLARKAASGWKRQFNNPIPLPRGGRLVTLEDAGNYITKLPKAPKIKLSFQLTPLECGVALASGSRAKGFPRQQSQSGSLP